MLCDLVPGAHRYFIQSSHNPTGRHYCFHSVDRDTGSGARPGPHASERQGQDSGFTFFSVESTDSIQLVFVLFWF